MGRLWLFLFPVRFRLRPGSRKLATPSPPPSSNLCFQFLLLTTPTPALLAFCFVSIPQTRNVIGQRYLEPAERDAFHGTLAHSIFCCMRPRKCNGVEMPNTVDSQEWGKGTTAGGRSMRCNLLLFGRPLERNDVRAEGSGIGLLSGWGVALATSAKRVGGTRAPAHRCILPLLSTPEMTYGGC